MSPDPKDESFRVIDRRLFNDQGELRNDLVRAEEAEQKAPRQQPAPAANASAPSAPAPDMPAVAKEPPRTDPNFRLLIDFLAQNAAMLLGGIPDPRTGQPILDLDGAHELIDMLDSLRDKTRGNLAAEEDQLLTDRIGRLKYSYLEMTKAAAQAMRDKAARQS